MALASGDPGLAVVFAEQASAAFRAMRTPLEHARALTLLADAHAALGDSGCPARKPHRRRTGCVAGISVRSSATTLGVPPVSIWRGKASHVNGASLTLRRMVSLPRSV